MRRGTLSLLFGLLVACGEGNASVDAASAMDSGAASDAGPGVDGGPPLDTGAPIDAGTDATTLEDTGPRDAAAATGRSIRFGGQGDSFGDRVRMRLDDPATSTAGPRLDVGAGDFTIELWLRASHGDDENVISCGAGIGWTNSNIVVDRDRHSQAPTFGVGIQSRALVFHVTGAAGDGYSMCGSRMVVDGSWHHLAVTRRRSDGEMTLFVDGVMDVRFDGPDGDISYPDDGTPLSVCPRGSCVESDPFLVIGAEKHGYGGISFTGWVDELRVSSVVRTFGGSAPAGPLTADASTVALYHFDEGSGLVAGDATGVGGTDGELVLGGTPPSPTWSSETPF